MYYVDETMAKPNFFFTLNENKTEVVMLGPSDLFDSCNLDLYDLTSFVTPCAKNLGFWFDSGLKFDKQINAVVKSCFFHLQRLAKVKPLRSHRNSETVIYVFISSCPDYCN